MKSDLVSKIALFTIALSLAVLAFRPVATPKPVRAESEAAVHNFFVEPGTTMVKAPDGTSQFVGKVMIDMHNGNIWGFPTLTSAPYPVDSTKSTPPVSHPIYLGKYDFGATLR